MYRIQERYQKEIVPQLMREFTFKNVMQVPRLKSIVLNMGLGEATQNAKVVDTGADELAKRLDA